MKYNNFDDIGNDKLNGDDDDAHIERLTDLELLILKYINDNPGVSEEDMAKALDIALEEVMDTVDYLLDKEIISIDSIND